MIIFLRPEVAEQRGAARILDVLFLSSSSNMRRCFAPKDDYNRRNREIELYMTEQRVKLLRNFEDSRYLKMDSIIWKFLVYITNHFSNPNHNRTSVYHACQVVTSRRFTNRSQYLNT